MGLASNVRVVYGDGASPELMKAAGLNIPRAIVITYANNKRCLEATRRLREAFPDTPIFVRSRTKIESEDLLEAGATEIVVEAVEAAVRFAELLDVCDATARKLLRTLPESSATAELYRAERAVDLTDFELDALATECGLTVSQVLKLYDVFITLDANDDGEVHAQARTHTHARAHTHKCAHVTRARARPHTFVRAHTATMRSI